MSKRKQKQMKNRENSFVNHWNIGQQKKNYDALTDKHASYYFGNTGVKKHLKKLCKILSKQPASTQNDKVVKLLNNQVNKKSKDDFMEDIKISLYRKQISQSPVSVRNMISSSKVKLEESNQPRNIRLPKVPNNNLFDKKSEKNQQNNTFTIRNKNRNIKQDVKHEDFMNFIQQKRKDLIKNKQKINVED